MLPDNFFADLAGVGVTSFFDAFLAMILAPLAAFANIIYTLLGGT